MNLLENLVLLYAGLLFINMIISAALWFNKKEPLYGSLFFIWLTSIFSLVTQGIFTQNNLAIVIGYSPTFLINIALSFLLSQLTGIKVPLKLFMVIILMSYPISILFYFLNFSFSMIALPIALAVGFPALFSGFKIISDKWKNISNFTKALTLTTCIMGIHNIDFAFLRMVEDIASLGFSIVIIIIFCLSIFTPVVVIERLKDEELILKELDKMKSRFFANISHEFRTPLTLIQGPIDKWLPQIKDKKMYNDFETSRRNSNRLLRLVNQLLDLSKLEAGNMSLKARNLNIVPLLKGLVLSFESLATRNNISLKFNTKLKSLTACIDIDKFEKIINNLLSNAFKFTPKGGEIEVRLTKTTSGTRKGKKNQVAPTSELNQNKNRIQISVTNTGMGIHKDHIEKIFDRFFRDERSGKQHTEGTGIGLALTKELVELHHGEIFVECKKLSKSSVSKINAGNRYKTTFSIFLPLAKGYYNKTEITEPELEALNENKISMSGELFTDIEDEDNPQICLSPKDKISNVVLIAEDNFDMRKYIHDSICTCNQDLIHQIIEAKNGIEGFKQAVKYAPDLIISDVMMPKMDGIELCHKIKTDRRTSHIPVILLTARATVKDKIEGLETGADDYIPKPFNSTELQVRVKNLIEQRRNLREKFIKEIIVNPKEITVTSMDETFLNKAIEIVENNIDKDSFDTAVFASEIGMSRGHLNAKLKAITDLATHEFIRSIRLKRAAQLLKQRFGTISEMTYSVGFNSLSHFSKTFKESFGVLPSEFNLKNNLET